MIEGIFYVGDVSSITMKEIEEILHSKKKPKEKQTALVEALLCDRIPLGEFIAFFQTSKDVDKGACADVMKNVSSQKPSIFVLFIDSLLPYINYPAPRVKLGIPETVGNLAKDHPAQSAKAIPHLLRNISDDPANTTVIK
jgi:hypothetical protein